jgi:type VI secretion system secreted protein VgrG
MTCGHTFKATGMPSKAHNQEYLVIGTSVYVEEGVQIGGDDGGDGRYSCDFQVMPTSDVFRAPRTTPKPMVHGPQTAMVVGPSGEHIFTDKYGRVKVQFHWDRIGQKNDKSSCWMRVSQPWAGHGFGAIAIPRIGDEVVVSFLEGDPDQPIITGRVYNAEFVPPYELPAKKHFSGLLTRSVGSQARAESNEFRFSDEPGKEYIWLQAQKDFHREVENEDFDTVKSNQFITVDGKREESIAQELSQTVGKSVSIAYGMDYHHDVGADAIHNIGAGYDVNVGGEYAFQVADKGGIDIGKDLDLNVGGKFAISSGQDVTINGGMNITIQATSQLTLKAGGNTIVLGPAGISIDGAPLVNINCGGGGGSAQKASPKKPAAAKKAAKAKADNDPN